ncbi:hypothetical protein [Pedobacter namyangjuensis]|uniref:hypothetical protein n=1 Tax=Pedobacter namyangjuensis TaxID=600626 RepID=UPI000DE22C83|nr:hypothetical protein [Pedobacter namyangjuensis]
MADNYQENKKLIQAWKEASKDLEIQIETPFLLKIDNKEIKYDLLIKSFGSKFGTLIITTDDMSDFDKGEKFGFYCSALNPFHYNKYDKENYIETLTDWGYYGQPESKPKWYEGRIYNNEK